jgi:DNA-binding Lrp family transcriptional regulator
MNMPKFVAPAAVYEFADRIREEMKNSNKSWKVVARILSEAQERFAQQPDAFKAVAKNVNLSRPSVVKLITIANDERLDRYADYFDQCAAWSVLYQITTLDDEQFAELIAKLDAQKSLLESVPAVNTALVNSVKNKEKKPANPYKLAFELRIDADAILTDQFTAADFDQLRDAIAEIANKVPFLSVVKHDVFEIASKNAVDALMREEEKVRLGRAKSVISDHKKTDEYKKLKKQSKNAPLTIYDDRDDALSAFAENADAFMSSFGREPINFQQTFAEAQSIVSASERYKRALENVKMRPRFPSQNLFASEQNDSPSIAMPKSRFIPSRDYSEIAEKLAA